MEIFTLEAKKREIKGKQVNQLRTQGQIPAVVYGHGFESRDITLDNRQFGKILDKAGESTLIDLVIDGATSVKVLIQEIQRDPVKDLVLHADLRQVNMKEKLEADIEFNLIGESPAVKALGAILVKAMDKITVRCLPGNLVPSIDINLSVLKGFGDHIKVKDITPTEGVEFLANPQEIIVSATEPISEEELKAMEAAKPEADVTAVKVETEEKKAERDASKEEKKDEKAK